MVTSGMSVLRPLLQVALDRWGSLRAAATRAVVVVGSGSVAGSYIVGSTCGSVRCTSSAPDTLTLLILPASKKVCLLTYLKKLKVHLDVLLRKAGTYT